MGSVSNGPDQERLRGRIVMSCRSHFFRDVIEQNGVFTGQSRANVDESDRLCLTILPFTPEQIRSYMRSCLGKSAGDEVFEKLEEIHNLIDLATRPVLLNMIREIIPELEIFQQKGNTVHGVDLYDRFLKKHMERDDRKHVFTIEHKLRMMEALAADMWISGQREWEWASLGEWLDNFLVQNPQIAGRYHANAETLNQDFRNATAVVRPAGEGAKFRFAHTSLQEYFLACWMVRSLRDQHLDSWFKLGSPSDETLDFFGQLLSKESGSVALNSLAKLMEGQSEDANLVGFRYLVLAHRSGYPTPMPSTINLTGANMRAWSVRGRSEDAPLVLKNVCFEGANLSESVWQWVSLEGCSFQKAFLTQTHWRNCSLRRLKIGGSHGEGGRLEDCDLGQMRPEILEEWPGAWITQFKNSEKTHPLMPQGSAVKELERRQNGHGVWIWSVCYDEKRGLYVSGSDDNQLKVWDAESLELVAAAILLPSDEWAIVGPDEITTLALSDGAQRHLMWLARSPDSGELRAYPFHR